MREHRPICASCVGAASVVLTDGREIYPHRPDLHNKPIWKCKGCGGYVGCHPGTTKPLGTPANYELRRARMKLHNDRIDPLWQNADRCGLYNPENERARKKIRRTARNRVYSYVAAHLGLAIDDTHVGMFDIETCRKAWAVLAGMDYPKIREWSRLQREAA